MTINFRCPRCQKVLSAPDDKAGVQTRCSGCQQPLQVPQPPPVSAPWYFRRQDQQHGPVSLADLKRLVSSGQLQPTDLLWQQGMAQWVPARSLKGLFPEAAAVPSPLPPPLPSASPSAVPVSIVSPKSSSAAASKLDGTKAAWEKAKAKWRVSSTPVKAGIVGGTAVGGFLLLLLFCILPLRWFFGGSGGSPSVSVGQKPDVVVSAGRLAETTCSTRPKPMPSTREQLCKSLAAGFHYSASVQGNPSLLLRVKTAGLTSRATSQQTARPT